MTWRDLLVCVLATESENKSVEFMTVENAAVYYNVGTATIISWIHENMIAHIIIDGNIYIPKITPNVVIC